MYYEINVALNGYHFFATDKRSITTEHSLNKVLKVFEQKFPADEGYQINVTKWETIGTIIQ